MNNMEPSSRTKTRPAVVAKRRPYVKKTPSARVTELIEFNEKAPLDLEEIEHDIQHSVAQPTTTSNSLNELEERVNDISTDSWETESLLADALPDLTENRFIDGPDACTPEEARNFRQLLRDVGPEEFLKCTVDAKVITNKKLLTAFCIRPPPFLEGQPDDGYASLLLLALSRELNKRAKINRYNTVDDAVDLLKTSRNIIVLTGAGISTSLGIPDFRSKGTGLYSKLEHLGLNDPQEVFDIKVFRDDPTIFYTVARDILPEMPRWSPTHQFIRLLQDKGKLLTNYSQNIDNLEEKAGIFPEKLVQCHGSFATASCILCGHQVKGETIFPDIKAGLIPRCPNCAAPRRSTKNSRKRKLAKDGTEKKVRRRPGDFDSASDSEYDLPSNGGIMKPDIIFFGEDLPKQFSKRLCEHDRDLVDLVVVIGTSLKVKPVSEVVPFLPPHIPQLYISRQAVNHENFDIDLLGDCDVVVAELCRRAGWDLDHDMVPENQKVEVKLEPGYLSQHVFTQVEPTLNPPATTSNDSSETFSLASGSALTSAAPSPKRSGRPSPRDRSGL